MGELFDPILELIAEVLWDLAWQTLAKGITRTLPMRIKYGSSWRRQARRKILARRYEAKGMA
jgi:hypothetical protein